MALSDVLQVEECFSRQAVCHHGRCGRAPFGGGDEVLPHPQDAVQDAIEERLQRDNAGQYSSRLQGESKDSDAPSKQCRQLQEVSYPILVYLQSGNVDGTA